MNCSSLSAYLLVLGLGVMTSTHGQVNGSIQHDGITRNYVKYVPTTWMAGQSVPLVFVLHGTTQTGQGIMNISEFNALAEANNFIVVYPDGIGGSWNTGIAGASTADDMGLIDALATEFMSTYGIDPLRVYSCGFSAGGYMSHRLACESPRCFAAIASVSGTMMPDASAACAPTRPTPVMQIHGTADFIVSYGGGAISGLGAEAVIAQWNAFNNCPTTPNITQLPNINTTDLSTVEQRVWSPCDASSSTVLLKVIGGGHQWPGTNALLGGVGTINRDIDASALIWYYFSVNSCPEISTPVPGAPLANTEIWYDAETRQLHFPDQLALMRYTISDASGRTVQQGRSSNGGTTINVTSAPPGIYLLKLNGAFTHRFAAY